MRVEPIPLTKEGQGIIELERGSTKAELAKDRVWFEEHFADEYVSFMATQLWSLGTNTEICTDHGRGYEKQQSSLDGRACEAKRAVAMVHSIGARIAG
jgi:hypothetical protein